MRHSKTIPLDDDRVLTVQELTVSDVRRLFAKFNDLSGVNLVALFSERFAEIAALAGPLLVFPDGMGLDDLTGSELQAAFDAALEVNQAFLDLAGLGPTMAMLSAGSMPSAADSSSADTSTSNDTAGASS